jgi:hypothetical protein
MAKRKKSASKKRRTRAERADPLMLYQRAVQSPEVDVELFTRMYEEQGLGEGPRRLREDFCGTAAVCKAWIELHPENLAFGVDVDPGALAWGRTHNLSGLAPDDADRVELVKGDVRATETMEVDVIAAQNFSYCIFDTRDELRRYFARCRERLDDVGLLVVDLFGGYESLEDEREEVTDHGDFDYVWEQHAYDPINARGVYKIHFRFPDGSALDDAFVYEWRLWTIPEVREVMLEAGFDRSVVYWEDEDPETGEGTGAYSEQSVGACDPAWNAYIVGVKEGAGR